MKKLFFIITLTNIRPNGTRARTTTVNWTLEDTSDAGLNYKTAFDHAKSYIEKRYGVESEQWIVDFYHIEPLLTPSPDKLPEPHEQS